MRAYLADNWFFACLFAGLGLAFAAPDILAPVTSRFEPRLIIAAALLLMAWTLPTKLLADELARPAAALWGVFVSYGPLPVLAILLGELAPVPDLRIGLLLVSSVPCTLASAVLWTRLAGGNEATALLTVVGSTLSSWLVTTAWLSLTTGTAADLDPGLMMLELALYLVLPVGLGQLLRLPRRGAHVATQHKRLIGAGAQVFVLSIVLKAGVTVGEKLHEGAADLDFSYIAASLVLAPTLHRLALALGLSTSKAIGFDRGRQIAVAFACSQKTLPVSLYLFERFYKNQYPLAVIPLLFYHVGQVLLDTLIARRLKARKPADDPP